MSRYKYGRKYSNESNCPCMRDSRIMDYDAIAEEVSCLRESLNKINDLFDEISILSNEIREEVGYLENSLTILEDQI